MKIMTPIRRLRLLQLVDVAGTFVLAIQGALVGAIKNLDFLGVVVVSLSTALGGGIIRDVLIGDAAEALKGWPR